MNERFELVQKALETMLEEKKYATLRDILITMNPADIAALFSSTEETKIPLLFRLLPKELAAETFVEMETEEQELLIKSFSDNELKEIVDELYVDDAAALVEEMPANVVKRILRQADPEMRSSINQILRYPENSAGSMMTTEYVSLRPAMTVEESILRIRRQGVDKETIYTCYVTEGRKLVGIVTVKDLLLAEDDEIRVMDMMETNLISVTTHTDQEEVAKMFSKYDFLALPVVDMENRMVGIVTVDDAIDVMQEEITEDMELMAAITPTDKPYLKMSVFENFKKRIPWLMLLMVSATFTEKIITHFEGALTACVALTAFIPMLTGTCGNCGNQSSSTIIRGLSLGEIEYRDVPRIMWKEMRVALMCGLTLSVASFLKLMFFNRVGLMVALVVSLTLILVLLLSKLIGCTLPILAKRIGFDPAVMASPLITTILDALSLIVYFQFATHMLGL